MPWAAISGLPFIGEPVSRCCYNIEAVLQIVQPRSARRNKQYQGRVPGVRPAGSRPRQAAR